MLRLLSVVIVYILCIPACVSEQKKEQRLPFNTELPQGTHAQLNTLNAQWSEKTGVFKITQSVVLGRDGDIETFYWNIPRQIKTVLIGKNVTVTGGLRFTGDTEIRGEDRETSRIFGTDTIAWSRGPNKIQDKGTQCKGQKVAGDDLITDCQKWEYGAVSVVREAPKNLVYRVRNLTIHNPRTYAITAIFHTLDVDRVNILNTRKQDLYSNSDGFGGGINSRITNSKIDTWDDAIKLYYDGMHVENVTIIHNGNGAPFQLGWSNKKAASFTLKNILVKKGIRKTNGTFNLALFSNAGGRVNTSITIDGLVADYGTGYDLREPGWKPLPLVYMRGDQQSRLLLDFTKTQSRDSGLQLHASTAVEGESKVIVKLPKAAPFSNALSLGNVASVTGCDC